MIIQCEKCNTKFNLDENLLKESGSKVRCTICMHVFTAFPPEKEIGIEEVPTETLDKTEVMGAEEAPEGEEEVSDFDKTMIMDFGIEKDEEIETISFEDLSLLDSGIIEREEEGEGKAYVEEAMDRAAKVKKEVIARKEIVREEEPEKKEKPAKPRPVIKKRHKSKLWITILLIIFLLIGTAGALVFFEPDFFPWSFPFFQKQVSKEQAFDMGNKRLSFRDLKGFFVDLESGEKLFIVSGSVVNNYPNQRSFIRIRSNILDSKAKVVKSKIAYAGNPINDKELQSLSMEEIEKRLMNKMGNNNMNTNILPNLSVPFMIIFNELPEDISEFTVEAISSSPAQEETA